MSSEEWLDLISIIKRVYLHMGNMCVFKKANLYKECIKSNYLLNLERKIQ